jgi:hypothetical protein
MLDKVPRHLFEQGLGAADRPSDHRDRYVLLIAHESVPIQYVKLVGPHLTRR